MGLVAGEKENAKQIPKQKHFCYKQKLPSLTRECY